MNKSKEPVKLRFKKLKNGSQSIYLDCYYNNQRTYDFLGLYINPERNKYDKIQNEITLQAALKIKSEKIISIIENKANLQKNNKKITLLEWVKMFREEQKRKGLIVEKSTNSLIRILSKYNSKILLSAIDTEFCKKWIYYLQNIYTKTNGNKLKPGSSATYTDKLSTAINQAVKLGYLEKNPFDLLESSDKIKVPESTRSYLTEEEFNHLKEVQWRNNTAKNIFLFCCYCGLRISDVYNLKWENIIIDGDYIRIEKTIKKTKKNIALPLCSAAQKLLPLKKSNNKDNNVFPPITDYSLRTSIKEAAKKAGINKNLTPHSARHTFATLLLSKDANIMTIKELLGHTSVETTMIYAKIIDKTKQKTVNLLDSI
ncbi:MAG: site-specific integrase [Paludibacteraceae bacterium]|nr:site-specific integrase [Paludibacteraceae bacterium]